MPRWRSRIHNLLSMLGPALSMCLGMEMSLQADSSPSLAIAMVFRNEAAWLREWVEYHRLIGATKLYLYDNDSTDQVYDLLEPYIQEGLVDYTLWHSLPNTGALYCWAETTQVGAYMDAMRRCECDWIALMDSDEFLVPYEGDMRDVLQAFQQQYPEAQGFAVSWLNFGTSDVWALHPGELLIDKLTRVSSGKTEYDGLNKLIVRTGSVERMIHPHLAKFYPGRGPMHFSGRPYVYKEPHFAEFLVAQINHYVTRTTEFFHSTKMARKNSMDNCPRPDRHYRVLEQELNAKVDAARRIGRFIPPLLERMSGPSPTY